MKQDFGVRDLDWNLEGNVGWEVTRTLSTHDC